MRTLILILAFGFALPASTLAQNAPQPSETRTPLDRTQILSVLERVADWQLANPSKHRPTDWTQGAGYAGMMALSKLSSRSTYRDAMIRMGETNAWKLGPRTYHADDHVVGQTYCELYFTARDPKMIEPMRTQFDSILAEPRDFPTLDFTQRRIGDVWSWCDALFMGPPAWVRLWKATDDRRYLEFAVTNWWRTSDYLYDPAEHLYFRDSTYFAKREKNGKKIFWSRGNGWVMGGLVRVLQLLPSNHPSRARFEQQFKEMAQAILRCQQPDGMWRASLLDPETYPLKETSGSAFHTYALAWGVNEGLLDRNQFEPAIRRAWTALVECVDADGKLTHVQPIGADPRKFSEDATEVYGVGAFLLAGTELHRLAGNGARSDLKVPSVIGHNLVLQQGRRVPIWGWAKPGTAVTVAFANQTRKALADETTGRWEVKLSALKPSTTPATLTIRAGEALTFTNILVGEVWFCSGQSNMEKPLGQQRGQQPTFDYERELASATFPQIRLFKTGRALASEPALDVQGVWTECSSNSLDQLKFSAAAYYFGRALHSRLSVPVGLIESSWGGTRIEPWTPIDAFENYPELHSQTNRIAGTNKPTSAHTAALYNGMVAPLVPFGIRGVIWYQGESNLAEDSEPALYATKMAAMINAWRTAWGQGRFPFYYVQIAPFAYSNPKRWKVSEPDALPKFWEAQTRALRLPNTGMIVTTDLVDDLHDIHPRNKRDVGQRLARLALAKTYGRKNIEFSGPTFTRMKIRGHEAVLHFAHATEGLHTRDHQPPSWFTIAGEDGIFHPATAVIRDDTVVVSHPQVKRPSAVRFAWHEIAQPNLCNARGLPAVPFRTDRFEK
jgi:rhamnogalacturonyl hydrolase YesR